MSTGGGSDSPLPCRRRVLVVAPPGESSRPANRHVTAVALRRPGPAGIEQSSARSSCCCSSEAGPVPITGAFGARFLPDDATFDTVTLRQAEVVVVDGIVFVNDTPLRSGLWVLVRRFTVVEENADGSRSSRFVTEVVQLDPATGAELGAVPLG